MKIIYEEQIDKKNYGEKNKERVVNVLNENSIQYTMDIREKLEKSIFTNSINRSKYLTISVAEQDVDTVKMLIGEKLFYDDGSSTISAESCFEELKNFENFFDNEYSKIKDFNDTLDIIEKKQQYEEQCEKFDILAMKEIRTGKLLGMCFVVAIIYCLIYSFIDEFIEIDSFIYDLIIVAFFIWLIILFLIYGIINSKLKKNNKKLLDSVILPTFKFLIKPYKFSKRGINRKFFERNSKFCSQWGYSSFYSNNTLLGIHNDCKFIASEVNLKVYEDEAWYSVFDGVFIHKMIKSPVYTPFTITQTFEENPNGKVEVKFDDYVYDESKLNDDFVLKLMELKNKYKLDLSIYFEGNIAYIMIYDLNIVVEPRTMFLNDYRNEVILEELNIIKEYMELVDQFIQ